MEDELGGPEKASEWTGGHVSEQALAGLRSTGKGPKFYKPTARTVLYKKSEVLAWIEASGRTHTKAEATA